MGGVPELTSSGERTGRMLITQDGLAELGRYVAEALNWAEQAALCLERR